MKKMNAVIASLINALENITIESTTESRSSHGRTQATTTTRISHKAPAVETTNETTEDPWLFEPSFWKPAPSRRSDGFRELWGKPKAHKDGNISIPVRIMDEEITIREYTLALTSTVENMIDNVLDEGRLDLIKGRSPWIPIDVQRARKLLAHHEWEPEWQRLRDLVNRVYVELDKIYLALDARDRDG